MWPGDVPIPLVAFWREHAAEVNAGLALAVAVIVAVVLDRALAGRGRALAAAVARGELNPVAETRVRFLRRLAFAAVLVVGALIALAQFGALSRVAASLLASGALAAAVVGFAARQVLANAVAGLMLAITQPLRIGDHVTFEEESGQVEDVRLNYTYLRTPQGKRVVIPNERLANGVLCNHTLASDPAPVEVDVWLAARAEVERAPELLAADPGIASATLAEVSPDGVRLSVTGPPAPATEIPRCESELRAACLRRLRAEGLLGPPS
jgi:small-conductance mechanosensitive channel